MNRKILALLILLASVAPMLLAGTPTTGDIVLRLKDSQQRPVPNVTVTIVYVSTDPLIGEMHKTDIFTSDQYGIARQRIDADLGTQYHMTVDCHLVTELTDATWTGGFDRFVNLPLSDFTIRIIDTDGNPLPNVPLRIVTDGGNFTEATNATGYRTFSQYNNQLIYDVFAKYGGREFTIRLQPDNRPHTIQVMTYSIEIRTLNDQGTSVVSEMNLTYDAAGLVTKRTAGIAGLFTQIPEGNVTLLIRHNDQLINTSFYVNESVIHSFIFDETRPHISEPWTIPAKPAPENEVGVAANITDEGVYASGMPPVVNLVPPVTLNYSMDGINWKTAKMFPQPPDNVTYTARLEGFPANSLVRYTIIAVDTAGNLEISRQHTFNTFVNETDGGYKPGPDLGQLIAMFWWIPAIVILVVAAYFAKKRFL